MGWFTRMDNLQGFHLVYAQENQNSCGIACVTMVVFKINKLNPGKGAFHTEKEIDKVYSRASGKKYDGSSYSYANYLAATLNLLKCGSWKAETTTDVSKAIISSVGTDYAGFGTVGDVVNTVRRGNPIIILVGWGMGGAHFVVVDTVYSFGGSLYAAVCDPWDGNVHLTKFEVGKPFAYVGNKVPLSIDIGGTHHNYSTPSTGAANGWIIHQL